MMEKLMHNLATHTKEHLKNSFGLEFEVSISQNDELAILQNTAYICIDKPISGYIFMCIDAPLLDEIYSKNTKGITIKNGEQRLYVAETVKELLNLVVGYATKGILAEGEKITISTPHIIQEACTYTNLPETISYKAELKSQKGCVNIYFRNIFSPTHEESDKDRPKLRIMVVDDSLITIRKITMILEELGHEVVATCNNGQCALHKYSEVNPDIVTMDITMPDMDGIEATKLITRGFKDALIIMLTSHGQEKMVMDAIKAGAKGYVLKPVQKEKLQEAIDKIVSKFLTR